MVSILQPVTTIKNLDIRKNRSSAKNRYVLLRAVRTDTMHDENNGRMKSWLKACKGVEERMPSSSVLNDWLLIAWLSVQMGAHHVAGITAP